MAAYQTSMSDDDRWALALYLKSIQIQRNTGSALTIKKVDTIPSSADAEQWNTVDYLDLPLAGQIIFNTRHFTPIITNMRVKGLYTDTEVALVLEWNDKKPNTGDDGFPSDAVRLQFPVLIPEGQEKPYFYLGDKNRPVHLWLWKLSGNHVSEQNAKGQKEDSIIEQDKNDLKSSSSYKNGLNRVVFRRQLDTSDEKDIVFVPGKFIPFSVSVFDGQNREEGNRAAVSAWYYVMLEPPMPIKVFLMPPLAALAFIGASMLIRKKLKNNERLS
jgi:DMSO reductase family type II enzyme heme b subunit